MKIGDEVYVHGYVDEIRNDVVIICNDGGYFGTIPSEVAKYVKPHICGKQTDAIIIDELNSSEKPNNCEPQTEVETMSCAECKHRPIGAEICEEACHYEPQTDWHYDEQDATWYPYKHEDEPQQKSCATCKHALGNWDGESNNCGRCCGADRRFYEPKDEPQTEGSNK